MCGLKKLSDEYKYELHPLYAMGLLENNINVKPSVKKAIFFHHENEDGSGFPTGKTSEEIGEFAQILHICDDYDRLISMSPENNYSPSEAYEYIMGGVGVKYNRRVFNAFQKHIPIYPKGITVELSNGFTAIVVENNVENPLRPKLRLESNGQYINLMMPLLKNITIVNTMVYEENKNKEM